MGYFGKYSLALAPGAVTLVALGADVTARIAAGSTDKASLSDQLLAQALDPLTFAGGALVTSPLYVDPVGCASFQWFDGANGAWAPIFDSTGRYAGWTVTHIANGLLDTYTRPATTFLTAAIDSPITVIPVMTVTYGAPISTDPAASLLPPVLSAVGQAGSIRLTFDNPPVGATISGFKSTDPAGPWTLPSITGNSGTSYVDTAVTVGTTYYYRVAFAIGVALGPLSDVQSAAATAAGTPAPVVGAAADPGPAAFSFDADNAA